MKLIFFNRFFHPDTSATSQILSDLAFHLAARNRIVHVVTSRVPGGESALDVIGGLTVHRVADASPGTHNLMHRAFAYLRYYRGARKLAAELIAPGDVIILKTDPPMLSAVVGAIAARRHAMLVIWLQDIFPEVAQRYGIPGTGGVTGNLLRRYRNRSLRMATCIVVIGERMATHVRNVLGSVPAGKIKVIHNWANGELICPVAPKDNALRHKWMLQEMFVVGYSGNLGRVHEFETLLSAARILRDTDPDICFLIVGRGPRLRQVMTSARRQGLTNMRFEPHQDQDMLSLSLALPDVHVCTLHPVFEGLVQPSKIYGVMAAGRPTLFIGDPAGETAQILDESCAGITVPSGESHKLASAIRMLRDDPTRRKSMGESARAAFESRYDRSIAFAHWEALLNELMP